MKPRDAHCLEGGYQVGRQTGGGTLREAQLPIGTHPRGQTGSREAERGTSATREATESSKHPV